MLSLDNRFEFKGQSVAWGSMGQGHPIILIHGFPWSTQVWRRIAPWLADRHTVYYFDMVGFGQSDKFADQDVSPGVQNEVLAALIDYWSLDHPDIVAHDFGGLAALRAYFLNGQRYRNLTLMDAVGVLPSGSPFYSHIRQNAEVFSQLPTSAHTALLRSFISQATLKPLDNEIEKMYMEPWQGETGQNAFYQQIAQSSLEPIEEVQAKYGPMECQLRFIWGEHDANIPLHQGEHLANLLSASQFTRVPNAAHLVHEDAPEAIVATLLKANAN